MNLKQLEALVAVTRHKSFRRAASELNTTQPAISLRIRDLEIELGGRLLHRNWRGISLTSQGRECLSGAERILKLVAELRTLGDAQAMRGRVSVGISELIAHTWFPKLISLLGERYPEVKVDATVDTTPALMRGLDAGHYDVVLAGAHRMSTTHATVELGSRSFFWMGRPQEGSVLSTPFRPRDLQSRRIIMWAKDAAIHQSIEDWFTADGAFPIHRITCNTAVTMATLASAGLGVALLPPDLVARELDEGKLSVIATEPAVEPVQYRAIYASRGGFLARQVAEAAQEVSSFL